MDAQGGNYTLLVAVKNITAFQLVKIGNDLIGVKGKEYEIMRVLSSKMKFKYRLVTPDDDHWGNCDDKGDCNGMIGLIAHHEADMAISEISYSPSRAKHVDFSSPYLHDGVTFVTKSIDAYQKVNSLFFTEPFQKRVWIFLTSLLIVFVTVVKILEYFELLRAKLMSVQTMVEIILRQSINFQRQKKTISIVLTLIVFVVTAGCTCKLYECMLTSTSLTPVTPPIDTVSDMVDAIRKKNYVISSWQGSSYYEAIMTSKLEYMKIFAKSNQKRNFVAPKTTDDCMRLLLNENFALVASRSSVKRILLYLNLPLETLHSGKEDIFVDNHAIALRKTFPSKNELNKWLNILFGSGLINKWQQEDTTTFNQSTMSNNKNANQNYIGLYDLKLILLFIICGCLAAFVTLLIEIIIFKFRSRS